MDTEEKSIGTHGRQTVVGASATPVKTGYVAYGCTVRVDSTQIKSWTDQEGSIVTNDSNENITLNNMEYIPFEIPITSITLNSASDSVALWLSPKK